MNMVLKLFLSMSCSGALLILVLFLSKGFLKDKISRQWQYYIWIVVIMRLLLPFGTEINLMGKAYQAVAQAISQEYPLSQQQSPVAVQDSASVVGLEKENKDQETADLAEALTGAHPFQNMILSLASHIWLAVALGMLIRKVTIYQSFIQYINAESTPVSDIDILDRLSITAEQMGIKKPVELCVNPQVASPLLKGFFHPCIVLPSVDISEKNFRYTMLHELMHYKRRDMFYKWLVQVTVCLHWFNPFVHLMGREITKACEFSCDEAILTKMRGASAEDYGKTLLDAMAAVGKYKESLGVVTLNENKKILKERLRAIMNFERKSKAVRILTGALTLCVVFGASVLGVYPVAAAHTAVSSSQAEQYYKADSLPMFQIAFSRLDEEEQLAWLGKLYADSDVAFFSSAVRALDGNDPLLADFAEKAYADGEIVFFSVLADCMEETELEEWLDRALEDDRWNFQSMLFDKLDMDEEKDVQEEKWEEQQMAEYEAVGVTNDGKNYYYQGQLANIFLDIRSNQSFYTLDINPAGEVNIKIIRGEDGKITGVSYMDEAEVVELLGSF